MLACRLIAVCEDHSQGEEKVTNSLAAIGERGLGERAATTQQLPARCCHVACSLHQPRMAPTSNTPPPPFTTTLTPPTRARALLLCPCRPGDRVSHPAGGGCRLLPSSYRVERWRPPGLGRVGFPPDALVSGCPPACLPLCLAAPWPGLLASKRGCCPAADQPASCAGTAHG